jgi:hypothetical protein
VPRDKSYYERKLEEISIRDEVKAAQEKLKKFKDGLVSKKHK